MSKGLRTVISVAAAVAIPFAAPAIAGSAALAGITGSLGMTASSALVGAGLGAAKGAVLGEDIRRNALMGGIGGGLYGYASTPAATPANVGSAGYVSGGTAGAFGPSPYAPVDAAGAFPLTTPGTVSDVGMAGYTAGGTAGSFGVPAVDSMASGTGLSSGLSVPTTTPAPVAMPPAGLSAGAGGGGAGLAPPKTFTEALGRVPGNIASRFTDPEKLADLTLRAAGQLAGSALATEGLSAEEQSLLNAQAEELRGLQATNQALFNEKLQAAQNLIGESKYFDPEYFGLQSARRAQLAGARAKQAGLRGLTGDRREAESRRFDLATGRDTGTAFDTGYRTGVLGRLQTTQAGLSGMPGPMPYQTPATDAMIAGQAINRARRREDEAGISQMFGSITGRA